MGVKLQINPSTGKLSYNSVTGKVQVVDVGEPPFPCIRCTDTQILLSPPSNVQCGRDEGIIPAKAFSVSPVAAWETLLNQQKVLSGGGNCRWSLTENVESLNLTWERYTTGACDTIDFSRDIVSVRYDIFYDFPFVGFIYGFITALDSNAVFHELSLGTEEIEISPQHPDCVFPQSWNTDSAPASLTWNPYILESRFTISQV